MSFPPLINSTSQCFADHVSKLSICHLTPCIAVYCKMLQPNKKENQLTLPHSNQWKGGVLCFTSGRQPSQQSAKRAGNIFFLARSPEAPTTVILTVDFSSDSITSLFASSDVIDKGPSFISPELDFVITAPIYIQKFQYPIERKSQRIKLNLPSPTTTELWTSFLSDLAHSLSPRLSP